MLSGSDNESLALSPDALGPGHTPSFDPRINLWDMEFIADLLHLLGISGLDKEETLENSPANPGELFYLIWPRRLCT